MKTVVAIIVLLWSGTAFADSCEGVVCGIVNDEQAYCYMVDGEPMCCAMGTCDIPLAVNPSAPDKPEPVSTPTVTPLKDVE